MLNPFIHWIEAKGMFAPWLFLALFIAASFLMIWRLEAMSAGGFEGTVLGTLVMPYCSGMGNLIFAFIYGMDHRNGADVMTNSLVNNVTNMTLVLGLPALIWVMNVVPRKKPDAAGKKKSKASGPTHELNRLSLLFTLLAVLFFTAAVWAMGRKGELNYSDGLVLVGMFLFWQCIHVFEVLKQNARQGKSAFGWMLPVDLGLLAVGAYGIYVSTNWLVVWGSNFQTGFIHSHIGFLSGLLMVLPNAVLAGYYGWRKQPEVVYTSQVGDAHVSIPLCLGIYALYRPMSLPPFFHSSMLILGAATILHFVFIALFGRLGRFAGLALIAAYIYFLCSGLLN